MKQIIVNGVEYHKREGVFFDKAKHAWKAHATKNNTNYSKTFSCNVHPNAYELACAERDKMFDELIKHDRYKPKLYELKDRLRVVFYNNGEKKIKEFRCKGNGKENASQEAKAFIAIVT